MSMNVVVGWVLVVAAFVAGWFSYGWAGLALAATVVVFWLLLQFNAAMRVMRRAAERPVGHVDSAVMLNAKLKRGMTMMKIVAMTRSLGRHLGETPPTWAWSDAGGATVTLVMNGAKLDHWRLTRPEPADPETPAPTA